MTLLTTAIYENGVLKPLTPISLPENARVRIQIVADEDAGENMIRVEAALLASGLVKPAQPIVHGQESNAISDERRAELAHLYATGDPLSEFIIAERDE